MAALSPDFLKDAERFYSRLSERRRNDSENVPTYRRRSALPTLEEARRVGVRSRPYKSKNRVDSTEVSKRLKAYLGSKETHPLPTLCAAKPRLLQERDILI
ncbi:hypothetical protein K493DRAFT_304792 [Basidiobolus meristosporus CBS 931.73]|uniref:Uncharacterized protein n=1 Tax=Basidiobolus meristosporus CBS 931.73 TaxID=1314790 RepID=A0A1Y1WR23_9FUNG|nr:hypothetical protein K493DRAFT_309095 [Basidiobolus meristosporus CBS 931.73]ORX90571.1 hypothetical protein K493DRAFT_304792 [Basidiobolus meristosporus CBS 931.73]|eukprot:ORX75932.1 hypothetical protein K493DRAFT_309095 [Basidiobolus meristosporus CBS 931.73]